MIKMQGLFLSLFLFFSLSAMAYAGTLCPPERLKGMLSEVYAKYKNSYKGENATYIPELAKVNSALFGIAIITVDGRLESIGDVDVPFAIESISKPFVYALALEDNGEEIVTKKVGLNATGHGFNSILAVEERSDHIQNALVNAGAIQITSLIKGATSAEKWQRVLDMFKQLSDGRPYLGEAVYQSESTTNLHNQAIGALMESYGLMYGEVKDAVDRYTKACSIMVTTKQLALMGATLANGGVNPLTRQRVLKTKYVRDALSEMVVNGLYEESGAWWWSVGIPAKSGVGGGMLAVLPNKMAIVVFSPRLDAAGNSIRAQQVIRELSQRCGWHMMSGQE